MGNKAGLERVKTGQRENIGASIPCSRQKNDRDRRLSVKKCPSLQKEFILIPERFFPIAV